MVMERGHGEHWAQKTALLTRQHKRTMQSYTQPVSLDRLPHIMQKLPSMTAIEAKLQLSFSIKLSILAQKSGRQCTILLKWTYIILSVEAWRAT